MSVDTVGCVVTDNKDVFEIIHKISENFPGSELHMDSLFHAVMVVFKFNREDRMLRVSFDCDYDLENHPEIKGTSCVWLSLGHWGSSEEIMHLALNSLSSIGDTYIDANDCDDTGFVKV